MLKKINLIIFLILSIAVTVYSAGESGGILLLIDKINADISGRGGVCGAWESGSDTFLGNPGLASYVKNNGATVTYQKWLADTQLFSGSMSMSVFEGKLSAGTSFFHSGTISYFDINGNNLVEINSTSLLFAIGYSKEFFNMFSSGLNLKLLKDSYYEVSGASFIIDVGWGFNKITFPVVGKKMNNNVTLGLAILNVGTFLKGINESSGVPVKIRTGVKYNFLNNYTGLNLNMSFGIDDDFIISESLNDLKFGISLQGFENIVVLNLGYVISQSEAESLSMGMGFNYNIISVTSVKLNFDYTFQSEFNSLYSVTIGYNW